MGIQRRAVQKKRRSTWLNTSKARLYQDFCRCPVRVQRRAAPKSRLAQQGSTRVKQNLIKTFAGVQSGFRGGRHQTKASLSKAQQECSETLTRLLPVPSGGFGGGHHQDPTSCNKALHEKSNTSAILLPVPSGVSGKGGTNNSHRHWTRLDKSEARLYQELCQSPVGV